MDEQMMRAMGLPAGFGVQSKDPMNIHKKTLLKSSQPIPQPQDQTQDQDPRIPDIQQININDRDVVKTDRTDDDEYMDCEALPISSTAQLKDHTRAVSAMCLDPAQSRFLSAGRDYMVKFWDFHSMSTFMRPFYSFEPTEGNPVLLE